MTTSTLAPSTAIVPAITAAAPKKRINLSDVQVNRIAATYDAAQTNDDNRAHWAGADYLSANSANSPWVRGVLRARSRYEFANNTYCRGMLLTLANDVVGTGPRLQIPPTRVGSKQKASELERKFMRWCREIGLAAKLRTVRMSKARDGEIFVMRVTNRRLRHPVKLDIRLIEADQVTTPDLNMMRDNQVTDGIIFDSDGNPNFYHVLKFHPGETGMFAAIRGIPQQYDTIAAANIRHLFRAERAGQTRSAPEITPALPLYAQLRRYTLAVIAAAETAADIAGIIRSSYQVSDPEGGIEPFTAIEIQRRMLLGLPDGYDLTQLKAEQPTTTYAEFKAEIINEIARCLNMPFNVAAGNSAKYNYASGRLDHQVYYKANDIERNEIESNLLDWLLETWLEEALRIPGYLEAPGLAPGLGIGDLDHSWFWDGNEHVDPLKEAAAQEVRLKSNTTTLAQEYAANGKDWETELEQRGRELARMRELGLSEGETGAMKLLIDTYGVGVRGGLLTPNLEDENYIRQRLGLPLVTQQVREFWDRQKGVRLPVTLRDERELATSGNDLENPQGRPGGKTSAVTKKLVEKELADEEGED